MNTVSYWAKNGVPHTITGTMSGYPLKEEATNGRTYYENKISGQSSVTVSGTAFTDKICLYPAYATYPYEQVHLFGSVYRL